MKPLFVCLLAVLLLSSCSPSKYMSKTDNMWGMYGYSEVPLDSSTYQVTYTGDYTQPSDLVDRYALYRSAEVTVSKGFDYFVVMDGQANASAVTNVMQNAGTPTTTIEHDIDPQTGRMIPVAVTTSNPSYMTSTSTAHTATKTIRMFKGARPADNVSAYDAKSMVTMMAPNINR